MNAHPLVHLLWILPLALLVVYVGSPRFLGTAARNRVSRLLRSGLDRGRYTVLEDLTLPAGGGTFHVDILVVSRSGIFVIDILERRGRIAGTRVQARWIERRLGRTRRFDNPVHENLLRIQQLERLLGLPPSVFLGLVAVSIAGRPRKDLPDSLCTVAQVLARVRSESRQLLGPDDADRALRKLRHFAITPSWQESGRGWKWLRGVLLVVLVIGTYGVYRAELHAFVRQVQQQADWRMAPQNFHPDGRPKTARERWEDDLICIYSGDTNRCVCSAPGGERAEIPADRCRELAERDSVLEQ